jgi:two-component system chemotaxis sensor kinase CheA
MDMKQYLEIFLEESREHLQGLNQSLLQLEKDPHDSAVLNEIFRVAHTLKGMSGTMGFNKMSTLTHEMENVLHALRSNKIEINTSLVDLLFKCLDALESYLNNIIDTGSEGSNGYTGIVQALRDVVKGKPVENRLEQHPLEGSAVNLQINEYEQNVINKAYDENMTVYQITIRLNNGCVLKSARAFIIFQALERCSEIIKSEPKVEDIEDEKFEFEFTVVVISQESAQFLKDTIESISEIDEVIITCLETRPIAECDAGTNEAEAGESPNSGLQGTEDRIQAESEAAAELNTATKKHKTGKTVRVDIDRLDVLLNLVSELIIQKTRLEGLEGIERTQAYNETIEYLERITTNLHDAVMKVRMVPIETVFNRFPRMIRDISKDIGKKVEFEMSGEETELDRTVIDEIGDPLIHLLRNSIDHGIESIEKRGQLGKPEAGHIYLRAYQDGNSVVIEVEDDGRGIDIEKVKNKAIDKGIITREIASTMSKKDIIDLLFRPSFSTAEIISDLSGRGVGLDVVKTKIESLGGVVEVDTEMGKGSKFVIRLPLTLAIIQALLVLVGNEKYAIQLSSIKQIIKISPKDIKTVQKQEVILLRDMVIPIIRLNKVLEITEEEKAQGHLTVVIVKKGDRLSGLLVDEIIGQQEIVQKSLGKYLSGIKIITSATILGDGNVALILDVNSLI